MKKFFAKLKKIGEKIEDLLFVKHWWLLQWIMPFVLGVLVTALVFLLVFMRKDNKLDQLEKVLDKYFVEDVDLNQLRDSAAEGMVEALGDRWSYYMTDEELDNTLTQRSSEYVGVGITISLREDGLGYDITRVESSGPAAKAGIQVGDILIGTGDLRVETDGAQTVSDAVSGEKGTEVDLVILRDGEELCFAMKRDTILVDVAQGTMLEGNVGLVTIESFHSRCADESIEAVEELLEQGAEVLIFDVRNNPGGYTSELIELLDYLLPEGPVFRTESYSGETDVDYSDADCLDMPMAVLVNGSSYSAAEFFAAAMQEYDAAVIVGEKTTGKGRYQTIIELPDGSGVNLSVGRYFTPDGISLTDVGVTPDTEISVDADTAARIYGGILDPMEDPQVLAAIEAVKSGN